MTRARNRWGWGFEDAAIGAAEARAAARRASSGCSASASTEVEEPVPLDARAARRRASRCPARAGGDLLGRRDRDRACHAYGKSYLDTSAASAGATSTSPDLVARPRDEARGRGACSSGRRARTSAVIPYGGGTSVVGGVEPRDPGALRRRGRRSTSARSTACSRSTRSRARRASAPARAGPRARGAARRARADAALLPAVVRALDARRLDRHARGRALRHAARRTSTTSSRRCARSRRAATWASRRLPGSGAGPVARPAAARLRGDPRRDHRGVGARAAAAGRTAPGAPCASPTSWRGAEAVRALAQSGLQPANCRLIDALEARADRRRRRRARAARARLRVDRPRRSTHDCARALELCRAHGGEPDEPTAAAAARRRVARGVPARCPTCATCSCASASSPTRSRRRSPGSASPPSTRRSSGATREALGEPCRVTCRFTHVYPDGPAPYFTVLAPGAPRRRGRAVARDEARRVRRDPRRRRHDHPPPRRRPRPPPVVRRPAPRAVRRGAARGQGAPSTRRASSTPGYSRTHERRGQELRGHHQGEGRRTTRTAPSRRTPCA